METLAAGRRRMCAVAEPVNLRQFAQWQVWPLGFVKRCFWVRVIVMELQRQWPVMPFSSEVMGWSEGSPVRFDMIVGRKFGCFRS